MTPRRARKGSNETVYAVEILVKCFDELRKIPLSKWEKEGKRQLDWASAPVRDHVLSQKMSFACTPSTLYHQMTRAFASKDGDRVVLIVDEAAMLPEIRLILSLMAPAFSNKILSVILIGGS